MIIILFTLFVIIVVSILGIEEDVDFYDEFENIKRRMKWEDDDEE